MKKALTILTLLAATLLAGCNPEINSSMATFNAEATKVANTGGQIAATLAVTTAPTATPVVANYDLTTDPSQLLIHAWGQAYGLSSGSQFTITATQDQVATYILDNLKLAGFQNSVSGVSSAIGSGQLRLDLAIIDTGGTPGPSTVTFQPTLDTGGKLKLNLIGTSFGQLKLPDGLLGGLGDSVEKALMGASSDAQSKVTLSGLTLENGTLKITGTVK